MTGEQARAFFERIRWSCGVRCPHCGGDNAALLNAARAGLFKCHECTRQFTVTVGTAIEHTRLGLDVWLRAVDRFFVMGPCTAADLARELGVNYRTALLMIQRLRQAPEALERSLSLEDAAAALISAPPIPRPDYLAELDLTDFGTVPAVSNRHRNELTARRKRSTVSR